MWRRRRVVDVSCPSGLPNGFYNKNKTFLRGPLSVFVRAQVVDNKAEVTITCQYIREASDNFVLLRFPLSFLGYFYEFSIEANGVELNGDIVKYKVSEEKGSSESEDNELFECQLDMSDLEEKIFITIFYKTDLIVEQEDKCLAFVFPIKSCPCLPDEIFVDISMTKNIRKVICPTHILQPLLLGKSALARIRKRSLQGKVFALQIYMGPPIEPRCADTFTLILFLIFISLIIGLVVYEKNYIK